jgi:hypothetical protein
MKETEFGEKFGNDLVEIFGVSGTCKTTISNMLVEDAINNKKKVLYLDTEKNVVRIPKGADYRYIPNFNKLFEAIRDVCEKEEPYDLVVLDSLGWTILGIFATCSLKERGEALLKAEAIIYLLKCYSERVGAKVLVLNQPVSEFNKSPQERMNLDPFGDKHIYGVKEVIRTRMVVSGPSMTKVTGEAFRMRSYGKGTPIFEFSISKDKKEFKWLI